MNIIPAIDLIDGQCVRLRQGDYAQKTVYHADPLEMAKSFEAVGIQKLHLVDLDGAKAGRVINFKVLERIASGTNLEVDFGGGIKTTPEVEEVFNAGAKQVTIGTLAVKQRDLFLQWLERYGSDRIILGADVKNGLISIHGWQEESDLTLTAFLEDYLSKGIRHVLCTDVSKDGMMAGPAIELYQSILKTFPDIQLIASGGVRHMEDLEALTQIGCASAVVGKAIYEGSIPLNQLKPSLQME